MASHVNHAIDALQREAQAHEALVHAALQAGPSDADVPVRARSVSSATTPSVYLQSLGYGVRAAWIYRRTCHRLVATVDTRAHSWSRIVRLVEEDCAAEPLITRPFAQHACAIVAQALRAVLRGDDDHTRNAPRAS